MGKRIMRSTSSNVTREAILCRNKEIDEQNKRDAIAVGIHAAKEYMRRNGHGPL